MSQLFYMPFLPVPTQRGLPAGGAKAFFYKTGTTTLAPIYADADLTTQLQNPVPADGLGRLPNIYLPDDQVLRVRIVDALGGVIGADIDPYVPGAAVTIVPSLAQLMAPDGATKVGYARNVNIALPLSDSLDRTLAYMGVPNSTGDVSTRLFQALADANGDPKITGLKADSTATYRKDGQMLLSKSLDGQGCTFVAGSNGTNDIRVTGNRVRVANLRTLGFATARGNGANELNGLTGQNLTDFIIENVECGSAGQNGGGVNYGFPAAGMLFVNCQRGMLLRPKVVLTKADAIHLTQNSKYIDIIAPDIDRPGDDGVALGIGYIGDAGIPEGNRLFGGRIYRPGARGVSVVGGRDCHAFAPEVIESSAAAFYFASESGDFNTHGVTDCSIQRGVAKGCVTGAGLDANFSQAVCLILGRGGTGTLDGAAVDFLTRNCLIQAFVDGIGARGFACADTNNGFNLRSFMDVALRNTSGTAFFPIGARLGGYNGRTRLSGDRNGGHLVDVVGGNLNQLHRVEFVGFDTPRTQNDPTNCAIYTEGPVNASALYLTGEIVSGPATAIIDGAGFGDKIRKRDFWYNGAEVTA